jgi:hypothetical protein
MSESVGRGAATTFFPLKSLSKKDCFSGITVLELSASSLF